MSDTIQPYQLCNMVNYVRFQMQQIHRMPVETLMKGEIELTVPPKDTWMRK